MSNIPQLVQSGSNRRPSKLPVPQQKKAPVKILQEHPEAQPGDVHTSVGDKEDKKFHQISRSHTTSSTSGFKVSSSFGYSRKISNNASFVRATGTAVPAGRIQSKDDINSQTFIKISTPNSPPHDSSENSSSSMANSSKLVSPRSTKLPRYVPSKNNSRLRKLVACESRVSQPATTLAKSQHRAHEPHNDGCLASVKMRRQTKSSQSSVTSLDVHTNLDPSMVRPLRKNQKKDVKYSDVMSRKSQGREQQEVQASEDLTMSPRSDSTTSGINETKSPCLLQTSESDLDTIIAGPTIHQVESVASTVKGTDSKSVEQIWVNIAMQKPSEQVVNCFTIGISNVEAPMELTNTDSSSDLELSPPGISSENCINSPRPANNDLSNNESNSNYCFPSPSLLHSTSEIIKTDTLIERTHETDSTEQWNLSDDCNQRARNNDGINSISSSSSSSKESVLTGDCEKNPVETLPKSGAVQDKACTGDWEMIAAADSEEIEQERKLADPIYEGPPRDTLNVYNFQYEESDGDNDVIPLTSMDQPLPSKNPHDSLPVMSCTNLRVPECTCGNDNGMNMKAKLPEDKNSYEPLHKDDPKNTQLPRRIASSSSSSQFSDCSTLSVGSDSSLISIKNQSLEPGDEVDTKPSIVDISTRPAQSLKSMQKLPGLKETKSSVSLRTSQTFPLEVPSVSLCVAALLSKCETSIDKSSISTESCKMAPINENESTEKDAEIESKEEDVTVNEDQGLTDRSYTTCNSSSSSILTSVEKQDGEPKVAERCQSKPKLQACPILGSRIALGNEMGNLHGSCMSCKQETSTRSRLTWKPNSRTAPLYKNLIASDNVDKGNNRNAPHVQMNCLVIDRTVSMCNVGSNLEGCLRIRNQSCKTICYRVSSCVPGKYQIIPPEGRLEPCETAVVTIVSALPSSFVQYEVNQFKVETAAVPNDITSPSEQRLFWRETSGYEIQTTMVGRVRTLGRAGEIPEKAGGGRHTSSGDGYAVSQVRMRREKEYMEPSSASICMYTIIIGLAAVIIHHYSAMLNAT